jgi:hypothetical protein
MSESSLSSSRLNPSHPDRLAVSAGPSGRVSCRVKQLGAGGRSDFLGGAWLLSATPASTLVLLSQRFSDLKIHGRLE